jgi:hypothetical protein
LGSRIGEDPERGDLAPKEAVKRAGFFPTETQKEMGPDSFNLASKLGSLPGSLKMDLEKLKISVFLLFTTTSRE